MYKDDYNIFFNSIDWKLNKYLIRGVGLNYDILV